MGTTNSKPPGPIITINQSEILSCSHVQFITLFFGGAELCWASCTNLVQKNQFLELNQHILTFSFTFWSHILRTTNRWRCSNSLLLPAKNFQVVGNGRINLHYLLTYLHMLPQGSNLEISLHNYILHKNLATFFFKV